MHFVAAVLPKVPICVRKLGDRTSLTNIPSAPLARHRRACRVRAAAPPECRGGGRLSQGALFYPLNPSLKKARMARGALDFVTAALPKVPICARKLGDRISLTSISAPPARHQRARRIGAAAPRECRGGASELGRFIFSP